MVNKKKLETLKYHIFYKKKLVLTIIRSECDSKDEKIFKEKESFQILKTIDLIN